MRSNMKNELFLDKSETRRFTEGRSLAQKAFGLTSDPFWEGLANDLKRAAVLAGGKHLDEQGNLKETAAEKRVSSDVLE